MVTRLPHRQHLLLLFLLLQTVQIAAIYSSPHASVVSSRGGGFRPRKPKEEVPFATSTDRSLATTVATNYLQSNIQNAFLKEWTQKEVMFGVLALLAGVASGAVMLLENGLLIDVVAWLCVTFGSCTVVLQKKLTDLETMRELTNEAREQVNLLQASNAKLSKQNKRMEKSAKKLQQAESALTEISEAQGVSVDTLVQQVEEYRKLQGDMKEGLLQQIRQTLISVVIKSDADEDFVIDPEEVDVLCLRLGSLPNVQFNEAAFRKAIMKEGGSIMQFSKKHLSDDQVMAKEKIFVM